MTSTSISMLPAASVASLGDLFPVTVGSTGSGTGTTEVETAAQLLALIEANLPVAQGAQTVTTSAGAIALPTLASTICSLRYTGTLKCQNTVTGDAASWDIAAQISRRSAGAPVSWVGSVQSVILFAADAPLAGLAPTWSLAANGAVLALPALAGATLNWSLELRFT